MTDTRTCAFPGDQEHDHEMCNDVVAERIEHEVLAAIADRDDETLGFMLEFASLLDRSSLRNMVAIQVLRDRLHEHALDEWRSTQRPGWTSTPHGKGCDCCGPGVSQWR